VHFGGRGGFWWKHGVASMTSHRWPVWWHLETGALVRVDLNLVEHRSPHYEWTGYAIGRRVLGRVIGQRAVAGVVPSLSTRWTLEELVS
jgi:hypothetical protein